MRFRLRTLLILLAVMPPVIGVAWCSYWALKREPLPPVNLGPFGPFMVLGFMGAFLAAVTVAGVVLLARHREYP
jgi:hypothetical protein